MQLPKQLPPKERRKRKRKPTLNPRFGSSSVALELGLIRLSMDVLREYNREEHKKLINNL